MRTFALRRLPVMAALLLATTTAAAAQRVLADVTGKWKVAVNMGGNTSESLITFKQSGDTLSGIIETEQTGTRSLTGTISGDTVRFRFDIDAQGTLLAIRAGGLLRDKDSIEGAFVLPNDMGSFTFLARRQP
jgi:hypothetical protein